MTSGSHLACGHTFRPTAHAREAGFEEIMTKYKFKICCDKPRLHHAPILINPSGPPHFERIVREEVVRDSFTLYRGKGSEGTHSLMDVEVVFPDTCGAFYKVGTLARL